ncbi:hypothetical protein BU15DRAFT_64675 [Melanogaster broomeanus]|nr:hypothetical protein BU15DRAFT_64675 [Melanogaster broomeanus]
MLALIQEAVKKIGRYLLQLTLYDMMRSSRDFEDVKADLNERTNWTIEVTKDNLIASASHMRILRHIVDSRRWNLHNVRVTRSSDILAKEPPAHRRTRRDRWCCSWELNFCALQLEQGSDGILR